MADIDYDEVAVMDGEEVGMTTGHEKIQIGTPQQLCKTRSLSDSGGTQLSPSPFIIAASRRTSKDDSSLRDLPVTPRRTDFPLRGLSLQMPQRDHNVTPLKPGPLSPKLDQSQIYASPTHILPRRSRGLDFSRAATSLHHSTLAEQSSPDASPTIGGRAMNIPGRMVGEYGADQSSNSLWSMMGNQERMTISSSLGSGNHIMTGSDTSSSSDDDDVMDDEMEDAFMGTPQGPKSGQPGGVPWLPGNSPAANSLSSFRTRPRKQPRRKLRGLLGLGFNPAAPAALSKSPPTNMMKDIKDSPSAHARRESISWAANQLHISAESDERALDSIEIPKDGQRGVIRRAVTRRGNLLPKTKGFARIRAALAEESAPVDSEFRREAEVIRQVRESDVDLEPRIPPNPPAPLDIGTAQSSPNLNENLDDIPLDDIMGDPGFSSSFKQQVLKNSKGSGSASLFGPGPALAMIGHESDSQRSDTPQGPISASGSHVSKIPPTAEEITRRINNKRRRDDDFDPASFKRRAVSPGMSVHNSPVMQSPMQRDGAPWGSRPGSNHGGDRVSGTPSENGSSGGNAGNNTGNGNAGGRPTSNAKGRVGFQGMVDTNDGLMRMSIE
ncbi:hypothetical protein BX600DRAFT_269685 [Xylariales sp. PMI_506]|nr:hypothetical protein BX600DRAFT_269685 [Xylariales sp. PMI_506]